MRKFRHTFSQEMVAELEKFSKTHLNTERKEMKEKWQEWIKEERIAAQIAREKDRMEKEGYTGSMDDILYKMYFSVRYYFQKKINKDDIIIEEEEEYEEEEKTGIFNKKRYRFSSEFLKYTDDYIKTQNLEKSPIDNFMEFMNISKSVLLEEIIKIKSYYELKEIDKAASEEIFNKIKKTYRNRYYKISSAAGAAATVK